MNIFFTILLIGISLSMDAFSLALIYGTYGINKKNEIFLSIIVGLFHFFMPLIGLFIGDLIIDFLNFKLNYFVSVILCFIGIEMIVSSIRNKEVDIINNIFGYILFGFSVSIDSFTTGIGINYICNRYLFVAFVFMLCSSIFTYIGLFLGNKINLEYGNSAVMMGGILLLIISICYIIG